MKKSILVSIVNYGEEQLKYLQEVIDSLNLFKKYNITIVVTTNINLENIINGVTYFNNIEILSSWQLLPLMARRVINQCVDQYDYYLYTENDHLWLEKHIDNYIKYENILPDNYISGLIQYEYDHTGRYYPAYFKSSKYKGKFEWDYNSVKEFNRLKFAHFNNVHQASFLLSNNKLNEICNRFDINNFWSNDHYSLKCKVNTEIYEWAGYKKVICVSEFEDNLIHHLPNIYINGEQGRNINQRSDEQKMKIAINKLLKE